MKSTNVDKDQSKQPSNPQKMPNDDQGKQKPLKSK